MRFLDFVKNLVPLKFLFLEILNRLLPKAEKEYLPKESRGVLDLSFPIVKSIPSGYLRAGHRWRTLKNRESNPMEACESFAQSKRETGCLCTEIKIVDCAF